ncbi:MAG TPA: hypothetical protein VNZ62_17650 [Capillimicrobium sp.]|nr:hypothetical protein [Capillimicrobium sp.]
MRGGGRSLGIAIVAALCVAGVVAAFLLLRPADDPPPLPPVAAVAFDTGGLEQALAGRAQELRAREAVGTGELDALLAQDPLDLAIPEVSQAGVTLNDVAVRRQGAEAAAEATVDVAQIAAAAPVDVDDLRYDAGASRPGELVFRGEAGAFGVSLPVSVRVVVRDGALVAEPEGVPVGTTVLFDDPRVRVTGVRATELGDGRLRLRVTASVA